MSKIIGATVGTNIRPQKAAEKAGAVLHTEQTLTDEQKAQARDNIGVQQQRVGIYYNVDTGEAECDFTYADVRTLLNSSTEIIAELDLWYNDTAYRATTQTVYKYEDTHVSFDFAGLGILRVSDENIWSFSEHGAVLYTAQTLTDEQKTQARKNIDAVHLNEVADKLCPEFTKTGQWVDCQSLKGYPLEVVSHFQPKQSGNGKPSPDNVWSITGWESVDFTCIKNMLPYPYIDTTKTENGITFTDNGDGSITVDGTTTGYPTFSLATSYIDDVTIDATNTIKGATNGQYTISHRLYYDSDSNIVSIKLLPGTYKNERIYPQVEVGAVATEYYPPIGLNDNFTADFGQTVYGGSLNWNTGALTVTWAALHVKELVNKNNPGVFAQYFMITLPKPADPNRTTEAICSHLRYELNTAATGVFWLGNSGTGLRLLVEGLGTAEEYAAWIAENDPVVAYPLAEPYTIALPPQEILALSGYTGLWGTWLTDITVTGREDPIVTRERVDETLEQHDQALAQIPCKAITGTDDNPVILSLLSEGLYHLRGTGKRWSGDTLRTLATGFYSVSIFGISRQMVILPVAGTRRIHYSYACESGTHWKDETVYLDSIKTNTDKIDKLEAAVIALGGDI